MSKTLKAMDSLIREGKKLQSMLEKKIAAQPKRWEAIPRVIACSGTQLAVFIENNRHYLGCLPRAIDGPQFLYGLKSCPLFLLPGWERRVDSWSRCQEILHVANARNIEVVYVEEEIIIGRKRFPDAILNRLYQSNEGVK